MLNFTSTIVRNTFAGNSYVAISRFPGDMYPQSVCNAIRAGKIREVAEAEDTENLLGTYLQTKFRKTPEGVYVNPWMEEEERDFWLSHKSEIVRFLGDRIPETELFWLCQDLKPLPVDQAQIVLDIIERNFRKDDINLVLFFSAPGFAPILKIYGDGTMDADGDYVVTKANAWDNDQERFAFGDKIAKIFKSWKLPDPNLDFHGEFLGHTPEIKSDDQRIYEHMHGLDLEPTLEIDMEREAARASKDASEYTWANLGWALARSANSFRCGGPKLEEGYSLEFFELLEDAPDTAEEFFHWLSIKWGNSYYHLSPDQQALWEIVREFDDYASLKEKELQFYTFMSWLANWTRAIPHIVVVDGKEEKRGIWSYKSEPMYGPKSRAYKLVDGEITGNVMLTSLEACIAMENSDDDEDESPEIITPEFYEEDDLDF